MSRQRKSFFTRPDGLLRSIITVAITLGYILYMGITREFMRYHFLFSGFVSAVIAFVPILSLSVGFLCTMSVTPKELVWKRTGFSKSLRYPSEKITLIRVCFRVHPYSFNNIEYSKMEYAVACPDILPIIAISHNKRGVALCCTFRKKLFLRLIECCPNAKVVACVRKNRPMPKRYREFLEPYVSEVVADPLLKYDRKYPNKRDDQ